jgi:hypothetical protein
MGSPTVLSGYDGDADQTAGAAGYDACGPFYQERRMQRNPRWEVPVSIVCGMRAAGR